MKKPNLGDWLRYKFDGFISRGTTALLIALVAVTICVVLGGALVLVLTGLRQAGSTEALTFGEAIWLATTRMLDPGTVADDGGWWYRLVGLVVTVSGVFLSSALVGILVSGLYRRLDDLRQGRTPVIETDHTLILGWSPLVFTLLHEIAAAHKITDSKRQIALIGHKKRHNSCVVILTERDRLEVEEEIRLRCAEAPGTRIVCRSGNPLDPDILSMVNPQTANAIIVLSPGGSSPDLPIANALIGLAHHRNAEKQRCHVIAALQNQSNLETMRLFSDPDVQLFSSDRLLASLTAQVCRQPGLLLVFESLLRFEGTPMQFIDLSVLAGASYGDVVHRIEGAAAIGLQLPNGQTFLNPPLDTRINLADQLIVVAPIGLPLDVSDQTSFIINTTAIHPNHYDPEPPAKLLILGWNRRTSSIFQALGQYDSEGAEITLLADLPTHQMEAAFAEVDSGSLRVTFIQGNPYDRLTLEEVFGAGYPHILILSPTEPPENQHAEVYTMITWLYLQDIAQKTPYKFTLIREVADIHSRDLVSSISPSAALVREGLVGLVLAQIAQNKATGSVLANLLTPEHTRIILRPAQDYVQTREPLDFVTVMAAAQARQETAIGYLRIVGGGTTGPSYQLFMAPKWTESISFTEEDLLVLLVGGQSPQPKERIHSIQEYSRGAND
jgi:hypothetical protein